MTKSTENNPGKYDEVCTYVRELTQAEGVILIVINGMVGSGFSVQAPKEAIKKIPATLDILSAQIRKDLAS